MSMALPSLPATGPSRLMQFGVLASVALLALGVYANSVGNGFALDDVGIITNHSSVQQHEWLRIWTENYWPCPEGAPDLLYRPLTIFSYLCNHALNGDVTWPYHAVNVALHALVSVMVTLLAVRLLGNWRAAAIAGVLFALHPLHTEVVANVVGRAELLAAFWTSPRCSSICPGAMLWRVCRNAGRGGMAGWLPRACCWRCFPRRRRRRCWRRLSSSISGAGSTRGT